MRFAHAHTQTQIEKLFFFLAAFFSIQTNWNGKQTNHMFNLVCDEQQESKGRRQEWKKELVSRQKNVVFISRFRPIYEWQTKHGKGTPKTEWEMNVEEKKNREEHLVHWILSLKWTKTTHTTIHGDRGRKWNKTRVNGNKQTMHEILQCYWRKSLCAI